MGCHVWFLRPVTDEEFKAMKEYAIEEVHYLFGDTTENREAGMVDISEEERLTSLLRKSISENVPCVDSFYWWELGWGSGNPILNKSGSFYTRSIKKKLYTDVSQLPHG